MKRNRSPPLYICTFLTSEFIHTKAAYYLLHLCSFTFMTTNNAALMQYLVHENEHNINITKETQICYARITICLNVHAHVHIMIIIARYDSFIYPHIHIIYMYVWAMGIVRCTYSYLSNKIFMAAQFICAIFINII